jgi:hypothetical protein
MKRLLVSLAVICLALGLSVAGVVASGTAAAAPAQAGDCHFVLGFAALHDAIPDVVGDCLVDLHYDAQGNARQETSAWHGKGGLLFWRRADNWTGFTDGYRTWVFGGQGVQQRLNRERFGWEADSLVAALPNAEYRLPFGFDPKDPNAELTVRLTNGEFENRERRFNAQLIDSATAVGDLDGDGRWDAVALLAVNSGGSGIFEYAVAMLDREGTPVQAGYAFLGDRVKVSSLSVANGAVTVDMITQGPKDPMCCPTLRVVKTLDFKVAGGS